MGLLRILFPVLLALAIGVPILHADDAPNRSKAERAFRAIVASGEPVPELSPLLIGPGYVGRLDTVYVIQVLDETSAVVFVGGSDYLLRGEPTKSMRPYNSFRLPHPHGAILDTATYTTPWGTTRTVPTIDTVDLSAVQKAVNESQQANR